MESDGNILIKNIEDGEIYNIVELDGIEVWGQHQKDLEQQALSHLKSLTEAQNPISNVQNCTEEGEISDESDVKIEFSNANYGRSTGNVLDINKYLKSQADLRNNHVFKQKNSVSEKSKDVADKISQLNLQCNKKNVKQIKKLKYDDKYSNSDRNKLKKDDISDSDYCPSDEYDTDDSLYVPISSSTKQGMKRKRVNSDKHNSIEKSKDDGLLTYYTTRLQCYKQNEIDANIQDYNIQDDFKIPKKIWEKLYSYQQDGVQWLWNIHKKTFGALLGDEMGLGKTVQVIVFLAALEYSKTKSYNGRYFGLGPSLVVCPATVIHQWVKHFHDWWPPFRVALLHQSGTYTGNKIQLINDINKHNGILVTTYESILKYKGVLVEKNWHYLILDEGHKIRNPNAKITTAVKQFRTPHKLILTGSPMQNNLQELWSLFDFIVPGKLGSQQAFMDYFATPITQGGYANSTPTQETTALLIATSLKNMINPFMLRRTKDEVRDCIYLPNKSEQVLFCSLTDEQRDLYRGYLLSDHVGSILGRTTSVRVSENKGRANILVGITTLRKICNHPDLYLGEADNINNTHSDEIPPEKTFGYYKRSGKMIVVSALLKIWKRQGHRVLLFTQSRAMVDIFEDFLNQLEYKYLKMDGSTSVSNRQILIDKFNQDKSFDVFLLTTRVGGLGVNLTGADRVVIYDPDWNPATDLQARERAWRIGQLRQVTVYRLVSAGTIEEKMYQRQVWKQLLSNKILIDPKTKRFFKTSDLNDLFSLQEYTDTNPETANIFRSSKVEVNMAKKTSDMNSSITFSEDKIESMRTLAQQIAKNLSSQSMQKVNKETGIIKDTSVIIGPTTTPAELLAINRKKLEIIEEPVVNKIDDCETNTTFSEALAVAEKRSINYNKKIKQPPSQEKLKNKAEGEEKVKIEKVKIDKSGQIDGQKIQGLVRREVKKKEKSMKKCHNKQDDYVLEKLFSKKGVCTALQHDVIIQSGYKDRNNLKVHYEAKKKADMALKALRKSRLNNWKW